MTAENLSDRATRGIRIVPCETIADFHACEDLQLAVWGGSEREVTPYDLLRAVAHAGGTVLGAWDGDAMIGMALSVVAWDSGGAYHHSHLLGVLPAYRGAGIGWQLKMAQRERIRAQGLVRMTWTYDPLEATNARLNIAKLGAMSDTYLPDFYGAMPEALNAGLPSDRLLVSWRLDRPLPDAATMPTGTNPSALLLHRGADSMPHRPMTIAGDAARYGVEIPTNFQTIKTDHPACARAWRFAVRDVLIAAFARGYAITGFVAPRPPKTGRACYLLTMPT